MSVWRKIYISCILPDQLQGLGMSISVNIGKQVLPSQMLILFFELIGI